MAAAMELFNKEDKDEKISKGNNSSRNTNTNDADCRRMAANGESDGGNPSNKPGNSNYKGEDSPSK